MDGNEKGNVLFLRYMDLMLNAHPPVTFAVLLPSESLQAMVLFYLFVMLKHSTNGRVSGVNCVYLHLGNRQSSLQQNTVAKFI